MEIPGPCWASFSERLRTPDATRLRSSLPPAFSIWELGWNNCSPSRPVRSVKESSRLIARLWTTPEIYGSDRVFVYVRLESGADVGADADQDAKVAAIEKAGHPVVRITMADIYDLGAEFFRWRLPLLSPARLLGSTPSTNPTSKPARSRLGI